jgi:uncharacterized caspase-like protein
MRYFTRLLTVASCAMAVFSAGPARAEKRVALVIGNSAYQHTPRLSNPKSDAADMTAALSKHGFQVIEGLDLDKRAFDRKVLEFRDALKGSDAGVFFYAGHGMQVSGQNYLLPIDAKAEDADTLDSEMVRVDFVHRIMERQTRTNILFLDACRDNPLARNLARSMGTRSSEVGRGLARIESGVGTLISFSTQPSNVALDGKGRNSPYTGALVKHLAAPKDLNAVLIDVRKDVMKETQDKQVPWENSALTGQFYFNPSAAAPAPSPAQARLSEAAEAWSITKDTQSIPALEAFIRRFGDTYYGDLAKMRLADLRQAAVATTPPGPASLAPQAKPAPIRQPKTALAETVKFNKVYGQGWFDTVVPMLDGGFVVAGREVDLTSEGHATRRAARVLRLDRAGNQLWSKTFGSETDTRWFTSARRQDDGTLLLTGFKGLPAYARLEWVVHLDEKGNVTQEKTFGDTRKKFERTVTPLAGGGYAVVGDDSLETGVPNLRAFVLDDSGATLVEQRVKGTSLDCGAVALAMADGGFLIATGNDNSSDKSKNLSRVIRFSGRGTLLYDNLMGSTTDPCPAAIVGTPKGGIAISGLLGAANEQTAWVAQLNADGSLLWEQRYGPANKRLAFPKALAAGREGGLAIAGCIDTKEGTPVDHHAWVQTVDAQGKPDWEGVFPGQILGGMARAVAVLADGGLVVAGVRDRGRGEIDGLVDGGSAWVFTVTPQEMRAAK